MLFAKSYGWIHDPPASMALPLGPNKYDEIFFGLLRRNSNHKNIDKERFL
jgi:hypothetical protein